MTVESTKSENKRILASSCFATILLLSGGVCAQTRQVQALNSPAEILKLGENGDRSQITQLRELLTSGERKPGTTTGSVQMALARLGDEAAMKSILCELHDDVHLEAQTDAFSKVEYVRGYTTIRALAGFLDNSKHNNRTRYYKSNASGIDANTFQPLSDLARATLGKVVPQNPFNFSAPGSPSTVEFQNKKWLQWLGWHDASLKTLQPVFTFNDVTTEECKQLKTRLAKDGKTK